MRDSKGSGGGGGEAALTDDARGPSIGDEGAHLSA